MPTKTAPARIARAARDSHSNGNGLQPQVTMASLADLHEHPLQRQLFADLPEAEFAALLEDMRANGQQEAIRILPDGTVVKGHQRLRVARELGWTEIKAIVVTVKGETEAEDLLIADNLHRRQLGKLGLARLALVLEERMKSSGEDVHGDLRDELSRRLGGHFSGRTLDRYRKILKTPPIVQQAVETGVLSLSLSEEVADLSQDVQSQIAQEIEAGGSPLDVVQRFVKTTDDVENARQSYRQLLKFLDAHLKMLDTKADEVVGYGMGDIEKALLLLGTASKLCHKLAMKEAREYKAFFGKWKKWRG
jgi:ParB-like chromosome segregation protein Spo0J